jgi:hypothetical protein
MYEPGDPMGSSDRGSPAREPVGARDFSRVKPNMICLGKPVAPRLEMGAVRAVRARLVGIRVP